MLVQPGVLLPLITLGVISSRLVPGALIDTCGNRPPRGCKMPLLLWGSSFTAAIKKWHMLALRYGSCMGNQREMGGDGTTLHFTTSGSLRKAEISASAWSCMNVYMCVWSCNDSYVSHRKQIVLPRMSSLIFVAGMQGLCCTWELPGWMGNVHLLHSISPGRKRAQNPGLFFCFFPHFLSTAPE